MAVATNQYWKERWILEMSVIIRVEINAKQKTKQGLFLVIKKGNSKRKTRRILQL